MGEGVEGMGQQAEWGGKNSGCYLKLLASLARGWFWPLSLLSSFRPGMKGPEGYINVCSEYLYDAQPYKYSGLDFPSKRQTQRVQDSKPGSCGLSPDEALAPQSSQPRWRSEAPMGQDYGTRASPI